LIPNRYARILNGQRKEPPEARGSIFAKGAVVYEKGSSLLPPSSFPSPPARKLIGGGVEHNFQLHMAQNKTLLLNSGNLAAEICISDFEYK